MKTFDRVILRSQDGVLHTGHVTVSAPGRTRILLNNKYTIILEQQNWFQIAQGQNYDPHFPPSLGTWEFP